MTERDYHDSVDWEPEPSGILCDHDWPPELDSDAHCYNCGLPYNEWSE